MLQVGDDYPEGDLADLRALVRQTSGVAIVTRDALARMAGQAAEDSGLRCDNGATVLWMPNGDALVIGNVDAV